jgi:LysR family nitrogen assimilation transcriptional regulator
MDFRQLRYFVAIVDAGSLMKGSERLHIAQPALSVQMSKLEAELGVPLLSRSSRGVAPTPAGSALYRHAQIVLARLADSREVVRRSGEATVGRVRIGIPAAMAAVSASAMMDVVARLAPQVQVEIHEHFVYDQDQQLLNDAVDVSIVAYARPTRAGLDVQAFATENLCLGRARREGRPPLPARVTLDDALSEPLVVLHDKSHLVSFLREASGRPEIDPSVIAHANSAQVLVDLVAGGVGATLIPRSVLYFHARGRSLDIAEIDPPVMRYVCSATPSRHVPTRATEIVRRAFVDGAREWARSGRWPGAQALPWAAEQPPLQAQPARHEV